MTECGYETHLGLYLRHTEYLPGYCDHFTLQKFLQCAQGLSGA